jgi:hypothetical protein
MFSLKEHIHYRLRSSCLLARLWEQRHANLPVPLPKMRQHVRAHRDYF